MCQGTILTVPILCHLFAFSGEEGQEDYETNAGKSHRNEDAASECFVRACLQIVRANPVESVGL